MAKTIYLEKTAENFIKELSAGKGPPLYTLSPADARAVLERLQSEPVEKLEVAIEDKKIPGPVHEISLRIFRPQGTKKLMPIVYFHGGGWILGSMNTHDRLARELAVGGNAAVVFVNFSRSPEAKFPIPLEEAYAATKYIAEHGKELNLDTSRLVVAGDSAGGNLAIGVTLLAKERHGPKIDFQALFYPVTSGAMNSASYDEFAQGPWLTKKAMHWFWNAYEPDDASRKKPLLSPLYASLDQLQGLPPALIITDENDVLRDEGEAYAHRLMEAEVEVTAVRFLGTFHDFMMLNRLAKTPATRGAIELATTYFRKIKEKKM